MRKKDRAAMEIISARESLIPATTDFSSAPGPSVEKLKAAQTQAAQMNEALSE
jgi:hypothetical protein